VGCTTRSDSKDGILKPGVFYRKTKQENKLTRGTGGGNPRADKGGEPALIVGVPNRGDQSVAPDLGFE